MTIECKYNIGDMVGFVELEKTKGTIISIWKSVSGLQYEVRYFADGRPQKEYFFEFELVELK